MRGSFHTTLTLSIFAASAHILCSGLCDEAGETAWNHAEISQKCVVFEHLRGLGEIFFIFTKLNT